MKPSGQLLRDNFRFATFDAGCRLQMAPGVKREWKKRNDGGKDYTGYTETAHTRVAHHAKQNRRQLRIVTLSARPEELQRAKIDALCGAGSYCRAA
jgi:hypothetical protein